MSKLDRVRSDAAIFTEAAEAVRRGGTIRMESDAGGPRHFLEGKPLYCGTPIDVWFLMPQEGIWISGRYEWHGTKHAPPLFVIPGVGTCPLVADASVRRSRT